MTTEAGQHVHVYCRKEFINPKHIASDSDKSVPQQPSFALRSESPCFRFNEHCMFCGTTAQSELKAKGKRTYDDVYPVRTLDFCSRLQQICDGRNDVWGKLAFAPDLHAADAVYHHQSCSVSGTNINSTHLHQVQNVPLAVQRKVNGRMRFRRLLNILKKMMTSS